MELRAGYVYEIMPGHDAWVVGDEPCVQYDFAGMRTFALPAAGRGERILATLVCTDIVDSTATAERVGPGGVDHHAGRPECREHAARSTASGATWPPPPGTGSSPCSTAPSVPSAARLPSAEHAASDGFGLRVGVHTGEVEILKDNIRGVAVHVLSRVTALAGAGEVLVSGTTRDLLADAGLGFDDRGQHELKGVTGARQIWALRLPLPE